MKRILYLLCFFYVETAVVYGADTLHLNMPAAEKMLIENNLSLLASKLDMDMAEAEIVQSKIWPNPVLTVGDLNPYVSPYQKRNAEIQPSLFGRNFGRYRQVSAQLDQLVYLAGKRKKLQAITEVSRSQTAAYLAAFLSNLKTEFRKTVYDFIYHQEYQAMLLEELSSLETVVKIYEKQFGEGNIDRAKVIRLKASELALRDAITSEKKTLIELQSDLIVLLNLPDDTKIIFNSPYLQSDDYTKNLLLPLAVLQEQALATRPDLIASDLSAKLAEKQYVYEQAKRVPDLNLQLNYERGGNIYPDFTGIGFAIDLPFSNSNKGNIMKAKVNIRQKELKHELQILKIKTEVREKYEQLTHVRQFFATLSPEFLKDLDDMMEIYTRNFSSHAISILEYMDFVETYISNKQSIFQNRRDLMQAAEDLKYASGTEKITE